MEFKGGLKGNCRFLNCRGFWKEFKRGVKSNWKGFKWRLKGFLKAMVFKWNSKGVFKKIVEVSG